MIKRPDVPLEIIVFMTTIFGSNMSYATSDEHAFIKHDVIRIMRVPDTKKLMF